MHSPDFFDKLEAKTAIDNIPSNPLEAELSFKEYFHRYPKDYNTYPYYISLLIMLGKFDKAYKLTYDVISKVKNDKNFLKKEDKLNIFKKNIFINRLKLASNLEQYEEMHRLIEEHKERMEELDLFGVSEFCLIKMGLNTKQRDEMPSYIFKQMLEYKEEDFLEHIKKHLEKYNKKEKRKNKAIFSADFPIDVVLEEIKFYIPSPKTIYSGFFTNVYIFKYDNCGYDNNQIVNYFKVVCFNNCKNFITMCPSNDCENLPYIDLNYLKERKNKVKRLSQVDKFKQKYNIY